MDNKITKSPLGDLGADLDEFFTILKSLLGR